MNDDNHNVIEMRRGTAREWMAAKIVLAVGFVVAIGVVAFLVLRPPAVSTSPEQEATPQAPAQPTEQQQTDAKSAVLVCAQELVNAKNYGIVPGYGQLSSLMPKDAGVKGRYSCVASTASEKYTMTADLICRTLTDSRCVDLFSVTTHDGTVLYQRQQ
ncbi:MAG: hypothetical protein ACREHE_11375 [Rhizomicrobium sp.]